MWKFNLRCHSVTNIPQISIDIFNQWEPQYQWCQSSLMWLLVLRMQSAKRQTPLMAGQHQMPRLLRFHVFHQVGHWGWTVWIVENGEKSASQKKNLSTIIHDTDVCRGLLKDDKAAKRQIFSLICATVTSRLLDEDSQTLVLLINAILA